MDCFHPDVGRRASIGRVHRFRVCDLGHTEPLATARKAGDGWTVTGTKNLVPVADRADGFLVPALADWGVPVVASGLRLLPYDKKV